MFCTTSDLEIEGEVDSVKSFIFYKTDRPKAVLLIWFSGFASFGVSFCTVFNFCVSR